MALPMTDCIQVFTTTEKKEDAVRIADLLVEKKLGACVQISGPILSIYHWHGKVERSEEWTCCIKTRKGLYPEVEQTILSAHPYDTPEIIALPITEGSERYLKWLMNELKS